MRSFVWLSIVLAGCGGARFRTEHVGAAHVVANAGSIPLGRGNYQMSMRFDIPRAQVVGWTLSCPGVQRTGEVGETFDVYRTRRLAELNRMVEQDRQRLATVTNAIAGQAAAQVQVRGPGTVVRAEATGPSGEAVAEHAIQSFQELPVGDVGAGSYTAKIHVQTLEDGACTVTTQALDPVGGSIAVDRVRDLRAEEQERQVAQRTTAIDARAQVRIRLVAAGADEQARERRIAEQAAERERARVARAEREEANRLRLEAEARIRWEAEAPERARRARLDEERRARVAIEQEAERTRQARLDEERRARVAIEQEAERARLLVIEEERRTRRLVIEEEHRMRLVVIERERTHALTVRGSYVAWLVGTCNADPHRRARLEAERTERTRQIALELEIRTRRIEMERIERTRRIEIERERTARVEREREQRQLDGAFAVRTQLSGYLVSAGARLRPPRPAALVEVAGTAPFDGARWETGAWMWIEGVWQWRKGGWVDSVQFGAAGGEAVVHAPTVRAPAVVREIEVAPVATTTTTTVDVSVPAGVTVAVPGAQGSISIDVTPVAPRTAKPTVRDHRRRATKPDDSPPARVRDHRRR